MKIYIIPEINSQKKLYIRSLFTEIKGYLTASLAIYNGKAKILLEVVTSKMLFRWGLNLVRLCLEFSEFPALEKCEKLWFHLILSQNRFFYSEKSHNYTLCPNLDVCSSATLDAATPTLTWRCLTHELL